MRLNILSYGVIPAYTILFAHQSNWFTSNFSVISQTEGRQLSFILWSLLIGTYFYYVIHKILSFIPNCHTEKKILFSAVVTLLLAIYLPYLPNQKPYRATLHVLFACSAALLFVICLYMMVLKLYYQEKQLYHSYPIALCVITSISILLFVGAGIISSALEIFFIISCSIFLRQLYQTALT